MLGIEFLQFQFIYFTYLNINNFRSLRALESFSVMSDCELTASMEDMKVLEDNEDSFSEGDLVFAKAKGYIAWPGIIVAKKSLYAMVNFLGSDDMRRISNAKIWPYSEDSKAQFITREYLDFKEFRDAILIAEKLSSDIDGNKENGAFRYRLLRQRDLQEQHEQEKESQEEARQNEAGPKVECQEESIEKEPGKEESGEDKTGKKEPGEGVPGKEEASHEKSGMKEPGQEEPSHEKSGMEEPGKEDPDKEEASQEEPRQQGDMMIEYVKVLRENHDSLNGGVEKKFIDLVNLLRHSLRTNHKDYPSAMLALQDLHEMTFSELLLVRNFEAVNSICYVCYLDTAHSNYDEAARVKLLAKQLMTRIAAVFGLPGTIGPFMDNFRSLSTIYRRFTYEFDPIQSQSGKEESCQEAVAVEKAEQERELEVLLVEGPEQAALFVEEPEQEAMHPTDQDSPTMGADEKFDQLISILRRSLSFRQKDYPAALYAFDELLSFTFTKQFLLPKYKAVYFIYYLARSGSVFPWKNLAKASMVRNLANQLMVRFFSVFNLPGITAYDFMVHFCSLYSVESSESDSDTE